MPAWRLTEKELPVRHFDIGAQDGKVPDLPAHIVLCLSEEPTRVCTGSADVKAVHMGPPLGEVNQEISSLGTTLGEDGELPAGERRQIKAFVDDRQQERRAQEDRLKQLRGLEGYYAEYVIHPPAVPPTAETALWRFSCAGFVLEAYDEAGIQLIDESGLPRLTLDKIKDAYPGFSRLLEREAVRQRLGIGSPEPWPIALPGYILNSLRRSPAAIRASPYRPQPGDEFFRPDVSAQPGTDPGKASVLIAKRQSLLERDDKPMQPESGPDDGTG